MATAASARMIVRETAWDRSPGVARSAESDERDLKTRVNAVNVRKGLCLLLVGLISNGILHPLSSFVASPPSPYFHAQPT